LAPKASEAQDEPAPPEESNKETAVPETSEEAALAAAPEEETLTTPPDNFKEETLTTPPEDIMEETLAEETTVEDSQGGWNLVGRDYLGALQARSVLVSFMERVIDQVNEGVEKDNPDYYSTDRFWAESWTEEWEVRLSKALEKLGMSREDWERVQDERRELNGLAHPTVNQATMKAAINRHIANSKLSGDTEKALKLAAEIASQRRWQVSFFSFFFLFFFSYFFLCTSAAWEVRLCRALEIVGMSREDWWRVSDERSYLNGLAHPQVPEQAMKAAMERHIANSNHSSDTKKALKLAAKIASDRDWQVSFFFFFFSYLFSYFFLIFFFSFFTTYSTKQGMQITAAA
jgi:hypothetical protein